MESQFSSEVEILPENFPSYDLSFKIIVIGNTGVGKSCLSVQATKGKFDRLNKSTIGFDFVVMNIKYKDKIIKLQIWDTCGQEVYRALITSFFRDSSLAVIVYAVDE